MKSWSGWRVMMGAIVVAVLVGGCASAFRDDSRYVDLGGHTGYYLVRLDSPLRAQLKLTYAPTSDTASPLHRGHGADVIAFRFNQRGVLSAPPSYICQLQPESRFTQYFRVLVPGKSTLRDVEQFFGRIHTNISKSDGFLVYYTIPVYNPLDETPSGGSH